MIRILSKRALKLLVLYTFFSSVTLSSGIVYASQEHYINVRVTVITPPCTINNNDKSITVDFGDAVSTTRIDGHYKRIPVEYDIDCKSARAPDLKMTLSGEGAGFDKKVLSTNHTDLGIALYHEDTPLELNSSINFNLTNKPKLEAVLVKRENSVLDGGGFVASATMSIEYQ